LFLAQLQLVRLALCGRRFDLKASSVQGIGRRTDVLLAFAMVLLGVATFVALIVFIALCDRV
jgi:hypothetical protein